MLKHCFYLKGKNMKSENQVKEILKQYNSELEMIKEFTPWDQGEVLRVISIINVLESILELK